MCAEWLRVPSELGAWKFHGMQRKREPSSVREGADTE